MPTPTSPALNDRLKSGLIVSVQQEEHSPLNRPEIIAALAQAVAAPGVVGLRLNEPKNIRAVRAVVDLPIIGIYKEYDADGRVWITPDFARAEQLAEAGCDIIALDATSRPRPAGAALPGLIAQIQQRLGKAVMADIATFEEGLAAAGAGAEIIATTLSGYTQKPFANPSDPPDLALVARLSVALGTVGALGDAPLLVAEGRYNTPQLARQALAAGAHAVVVGSAITRPDLIVQRFTQGLTGTVE